MTTIYVRCAVCGRVIRGRQPEGAAGRWFPWPHRIVTRNHWLPWRREWHWCTGNNQPGEVEP